MARPGRKRKNPEMMPTMLRTAFLAYVRVLLCLQGMYLLFGGWVLSSDQGPDTRVWVLRALALIAAFLGLAGIVTAVLLRRGRRGAAIAAIVIEALWAAAAAAIGYQASMSGALVWQLFAGAALFLVTVVGLLLPPVRAYARARSPLIARLTWREAPHPAGQPSDCASDIGRSRKEGFLEREKTRYLNPCQESPPVSKAPRNPRPRRR